MENTARISASDPAVQYWGRWEEEQKSCTQYSTCVFSFRGDTVSCRMSTGPDFGRADFYLDEQFLKTADCYRPKAGAETVCTETGLSAGRVHHLRIVVRKDHDPASAGAGVQVLGFEAEEPVDYPAELTREMNAEYKEIQELRKPVHPCETWKPVPQRAAAPNGGVKLLDGVMKTLWQNNIDLVKRDFRIPDYCEGDSVLPQQGGHGWSSWLPGSTEGRLLAGAANALCWEEDPELREIVTKIVGDIKARTREDGYYNYYPETDAYSCIFTPEDFRSGAEVPNAMFTERKNYDRVFWTRGLLAAHQAGNPDALKLVRGMYDWLYQQEAYLKFLLLGGNSTNGMPGGPLLYHTEAGKPEDIYLNERFYNQNYWFRSMREEHPMLFSHYPGERPHCYDLLQLETLADLYRATGLEEYRTALQGGWNVYLHHYKHIGGATAICEGGGPYEPKSYYLTTGHNGETCGSVFWIWTNHKMHLLCPEEEKYTAEIEESLFNVLLACRMKDGKTRYHNRLHGHKQEGGNCGSCCEVSSTILLSSLPQYLYSEAPGEVYVNLLVPSEYRGADLALRMDTAFPENGVMALTVLEDCEKENTVHLRIPQWAGKNVEISVNGVPAAEGIPGTYAAVTRRWQKGDRICAEFPMKFRLLKYTGFDQAEGNKDRHALLYGPILMALTGELNSSGLTELPYCAEELAGKLIPAEEPLTYGIEGVPGLYYRPYYAVGDERMTCFPIIEGSSLSDNESI